MLSKLSTSKYITNSQATAEDLASSTNIISRSLLLMNCDIISNGTWDEQILNYSEPYIRHHEQNKC